MSPRTVADAVLRPAPVLRDTDTLGAAVAQLLESELPGLPVADEAGRYAGLFGEREFLGALFPRYVQTLGYVGFVPRSIEADLDRRRREADRELEAYAERRRREADRLVQAARQARWPGEEGGRTSL